MSETPIRDRWQDLHRQSRFRPLYPSEIVVRFLMSSVPHEVDDRQQLRVLDIGCGAGRHTVLFAEHGFCTYAVDFSAGGLEATGQRLLERGLSAKLAAGTMHQLPYMDSVFDAVVSFGVLEYNDWSSLQCAVQELYRVLRPTGKALIITRTMADSRYGRGKRVDDHSYLLETAETNESGMVNCFLDRNDVSTVFRAFRGFQVERTELMRANGWLDSDWVVTATK